MSAVSPLIQAVGTARQLFIEQLAAVTGTQAQWQPAPDVWSITDNAEHLFWTEQGDIVGMWKTLHPISGPLDFQQRLAFLRFHLDRHRQQVAGLLRELP